MAETAHGELSKRSMKRPMNAFLIFCKRQRGHVREKNPHVDNRSVTRILGDLWANLDVDEKSVYTNLAKQYKDAFLKENPTYKWYNPTKHTQAAVVSKSTDVLPVSSACTNSSAAVNTLSLEQISAGKLADESVIGGLSLLLMAGQQTVTVTASPMMTERKPNNLLLNTVTLGSHEDVQSLTQQGLVDVSWTGADVVERPMDLSRSAVSSNAPPNTTAVKVSTAHCNVSPASIICRDSLVSSSVSRESLMLPAICHSNVPFVNSPPHASACRTFTVPSSSVNQTSVTPVILCSAGECAADFNTAVKSDTLSNVAESSSRKIPAGNDSAGSVQYPKTKKQRAIDSQVLSMTDSLSVPTLDGKESQYEALTFGEIQERLITKVVESGSLSGVLCDDRRHIVSKHHWNRNLPTERFSHFETSLNSPCLPQSSLQKAGRLSMASASLFRTQQPSVVSSTQEARHISPSSVPSSAAHLLLPMISQLDVNLLIEHELTKTAESTTSALTVHAGHQTADKMSAVSAASQSVTGHQPLSATELIKDGNDRWPVDCKLSTNHSEALCLVRQSSVHEEQPLCCKLEPSADIKTSDTDGLAAEIDSSSTTQCALEQTTTNLPPAHESVELASKSSTAVAELCENRLSTHEINNNCRRSYPAHSKKVVGKGRDAVVRKSKRCNRGRRYHELMSQGMLPHHASRKHSRIEANGEEKIGCSEAVSGHLDVVDSDPGLQERYKHFKSGCGSEFEMTDKLSEHQVSRCDETHCCDLSDCQSNSHSPAMLAASSSSDCTLSQWINISQLQHVTRVTRQSVTHRRKPPKSSVVRLLAAPSLGEQLTGSTKNNSA